MGGLEAVNISGFTISGPTSSDLGILLLRGLWRAPVNDFVALEALIVAVGTMSHDALSVCLNLDKNNKFVP